MTDVSPMGFHPTKPALAGLIILGFVLATGIVNDLRERRHPTPAREASAAPVPAVAAPTEKTLSTWEIEYAVKSWLNGHLRDPRSLEDLTIVNVERGGVEKSVLATGTYRAKNGFGGYNFARSLFLVHRSGQVATSAEWSDPVSWNALIKFYRKTPLRSPRTASSAR